MTTLPLNRPRQLGGARRILLALALLLALSGGVVWAGFQLWRQQEFQRQSAALLAPPQTDIAALEMAEFAFSAPHVQLPVGATLTWTNADEAEHDVVFRSGERGPLLPAGGSYSHTFTTPGSFEYYCSAHPFMVGKVTVTP